MPSAQATATAAAVPAPRGSRGSACRDGNGRDHALRAQAAATAAPHLLRRRRRRRHPAQAAVPATPGSAGSGQKATPPRDGAAVTATPPRMHRLRILRGRRTPPDQPDVSPHASDRTRQHGLTDPMRLRAPLPETDRPCRYRTCRPTNGCTGRRRFAAHNRLHLPRMAR